ncbi:MAG: glycosyltransferase [Geminicoccaceae bacterium]|nr:glycosyltransferase [Geminicoccaceae bacterium]MDW8370769.1 glycosyltransferase [Geminicoccaceae bacterium]
MSLPRPAPAPARRFAVVCFGLERDRVRRQPWHVAMGIARGLAAHGHAVILLTDARDPPEEPAVSIQRVAQLEANRTASVELRAAIAEAAVERVFWITGATALARTRPLELAAPVTFVMASPRARPGELLALGPAALWRERAVVALPLVNALLPGFQLRRGFARSGAEDLLYLSETAAQRYAALGLPRGRLLRPQVDAALCTNLPPPAGTPRIAYLGPALAARGVDLAIDAFERARALGLDGCLELLIRPDGGPRALAWLQRRLASSPVADAIELETRMLEPDELRARLARCHAFLLPFRAPISEVPLVVAEAALTGRPVIVLEAPGVGEYARALGGIVAARPEDLPGALVRALAAPGPRPDPAVWTRWDRAVAPLLQPAGVRRLGDLRLLAICGVDGAGKTTVLGRLRERLGSQGLATRHQWSRFRNYLSKPLLALARLTGHNRKERHQGFTIGYHDFRGTAYALPFLVLQLLDTIVDTILRFRHGRAIILSDRCLLDTLVDWCVDTGLDELVLDRLGPRLLRLLPAPAAAVVLVRHPGLIAAGRPDAVADKNFARRRALYLRLAARYRLPIIENDGPIEQTVEAILEAVRAGRAELARLR